MSSRCDYCSGFGCIGTCHDLPLPGARVGGLSRLVLADDEWLDDSDQSDNLTAEDRLNQRSTEEKA